MQLWMALWLLVTAWFGDVPLPCLVDSGSTATILSEGAAAQVPTLGEPWGTRPLGGLTDGGLITGTYRTVPEVWVGDLYWTDVPVVVVPGARIGALEHTCILGATVLARQDLVIDWKGRTLRAATSPEVDAEAVATAPCKEEEDGES